MSTIDETKECTFCAETIKRDAVICRFCNYDLRTGASATISSPSQSVVAELQSPPTVQARSGVMDGVKIGAGMFIVLPLLCILGLMLMCSLGGVIR